MISRRKFNGLILMGSTFLFCLALGISPSAAQEAASGFLPSTPLEVAQGTANLVGHYAPTKTLRLAIMLRPPNWAEEQKFLQEVQTKGSPQFHHFLTAEQWNARFAPSVADEQAVVDWAQSQGMQVTYRYANRLIVDVQAPAATLEKAFGVTINSYQSDSRTFYSNDRDPQLPSSLGNVVHAVIGLNNSERMHPANKNVNVPGLTRLHAGTRRKRAGQFPG